MVSVGLALEIRVISAQERRNGAYLHVVGWAKQVRHIKRFFVLFG